MSQSVETPTNQDRGSPFDPVDTLFIDTQSYCSHCRIHEHDHLEATGKQLLQCSRCKMSKYCSRDCQTKNFALHRASCKRIARLQERIQQVLDDDAAALASGASAALPSTEKEEKYCKLQMALANAIVEMAYRSTDTIERGAHLFEYAARSLIEAMRVSYSVDMELEEKVAFLLTALGREEAAFSLIYFTLINQFDETTQICLRVCSKPGDWIYPTFNRYYDMSRMPGMATVETISLTLLVTLLLIKMRIVADCRINETSFCEVFATTSSGIHLDPVHSVILEYLMGDDGFYDCQRKQMEHILSLIYLLDPPFPNKLRDSIPLSPLDAPLLFDSTDTPEEFWYLFQDCFFLSPGINDLLYEYVSDE